ncbi:MAG: hypothetical protein ACE5I1_32300, partial [bacterium]
MIFYELYSLIFFNMPIGIQFAIDAHLAKGLFFYSVRSYYHIKICIVWKITPQENHIRIHSAARLW